MEDEAYFERFARLQYVAESCGVCVVQENVSRCTGGSLDFLVKMKTTLGDKACFVLAGIDENSLLQAVELAVEMNNNG